MSEKKQPDEPALLAEIARLNKIIQSLMNRAERNASVQGSDFNLFHTAVTLEDEVRRRTEELKAALLENEKITRALRESENHKRLLIENSPMCIHEVDMNGRITSMSNACLLMMGLKEEREALGYVYLDAICDADRERIAGLLDKAYAGDTSHFEFRASGPGGQIYKSCFVPIKNKKGKVEKLMGIVEDITERKKAEEQIRDLALCDTLTHLANRRLMNERMGQAMTAGKRSGRYGAVVFLDLDNFKPLNDTYGHEVGDLLLIEVAHRLTNCVRETDTVARFGGDEFVVMLSDLGEDKALSAARAGAVAEKIRTALAEPYFLQRGFHEMSITGESCQGSTAEPSIVPHPSGDYVESAVEHHCTSSIGVALFISDECSPGEILRRADTAMYQAKENGRNQIQFFEA